jgi:hypothetical protein
MMRLMTMEMMMMIHEMIVALMTEGVQKSEEKIEEYQLKLG